MKPDPQMTRRLLIRADGSDQVGNGHVIRMLALAQAWRDRGGMVALATRECPEFVLEQYRKESAQIIRLGSQPLLDEARELKQHAFEGSTDVVVLDGYSFDPEYQALVSQGNFRMMVVDDYRHLQRYWADVILNQNLEASQADYHDCAPGIPILAGLDYVLLRREFRNAVSNQSGRTSKLPATLRGNPDSGTNVLVTLGGTDPQNLAELVLRAIGSLIERFSLQVRLLVGNSKFHRDALESIVNRCSWLTVLTDVADMVPQYAWADMAIVGAGSTNWELCCFGVPRLMIVLADNQVAIADGLERAGVAINLGDWKDLSTTKISNALADLLDDPVAQDLQSRKSLNMIDGQGAARVVNYILDSVATEKS